MGFPWLWRAGSTLRCGARVSHCSGFSCCRAWALGMWASVVVARGLQQLWLTGLVAPRHVGSSQARARTRVPCIGRQTPNHCATREALNRYLLNKFLNNIQSEFRNYAFLIWYFILPCLKWGQAFVTMVDLLQIYWANLNGGLLCFSSWNKITVSLIAHLCLEKIGIGCYSTYSEALASIKERRGKDKDFQNDLYWS